MHKGPLGVPRPGVRCSPNVTFEIESAVRDIDEEELSEEIDAEVSVEEGLVPATADVVIKTGEATIENETFEELEDKVVAVTQMPISGWRIGEI